MRCVQAALWLGLIGLIAPGIAGCRQATGLDGFVVQCVPGEPDCPDPDAPEDCVAGLDTNGDGVLPPDCSGEVAWLRVTPGNGQKTCNTGLNGFQIEPVRRLVAMASFGAWSGAVGTLRGDLGPCIQNQCVSEAHGLDGAGDQFVFEPSTLCDDGGRLHALARGEGRAYAATARRQQQQEEGVETQLVVLSAHRLADASFASRWEWQPPADVTRLALAADGSAVIAVGQAAGVLVVEPDRDLPQARFHRLAGAQLSSIAVTRAGAARVVLLAGQTVSPAADPGPCGLGATSPTAFVARATLGEGSMDSASPAAITCAGFPVELPIGTDTQDPSMKVAALRDGRACWAYLGTDSATNKRRLRVGCFALGAPVAPWKQEAILGDHIGEDVDIAVDPFGNVVVTAALSRVTQLGLWGGATVPLAAPDTPNILVAKLRADTGAVVWAQMFAAPGGDARNPHVAADDDGGVQLGVVTDGQALTGKALGGAFGASGLAVHFVGLRP